MGKVEVDIDELIDYQLGHVSSCERWAPDSLLAAEREILRILQLHKSLSPIDGHCPTCGSKNIYLYEQEMDYDYADNMVTFLRQSNSNVCLDCAQMLENG